MFYPLVHKNGKHIGIIRLVGIGFPSWSVDEVDNSTGNVEDNEMKDTEENEHTKIPQTVVNFMDYFAYRIEVSMSNTEALPFSGLAFRLIKNLLCDADVHKAVENVANVATTVLQADRASLFLVDRGKKVKIVIYNSCIDLIIITFF